MKKIEKLLNGQEENYIFPFLWMHGESEEVIKEYVNKIYESGIKALCVEPRPHPDFVGGKWWTDLKIVLEAAEEKNMKVWLFDDAHFPTGFANGAIMKDFPELRKKFLKISQVDYHGPQKDAGIIVKWHAGGNRNTIMTVGTDETQLQKALEASEEKIIAVIAAKIINYETIDTNTLVDISHYMENGVIYWDIPEGNWRVFTLVETYNGGEASTEGYLNPIDPAATQVLIDAVYQPHFEHFSEYFGTTIAGFFTDEPRFGNVKGPDALIGKTEMVLPWRSDLLSLLEEKLGEQGKILLPLLMTNGTEKQSLIRYVYMDLVSQLYSDNFSGKLASWCDEHGVEYIGHLIEDNNAHGRLGYGAGHFHRAINGQSMSGIDVVLHQLLPGLDDDYFKTFTSTGWDGEFFHYALAKLGSSFGHLDDKKKGRTMCEIYGAYGWSEGLNLMKWMTDHMLVRGVNHFVPHAFDMAPYPDTDCPPHFYAHGNNPQYRHLHQLMNYTNRVAELLSGGIHVASSLILYHAEAEWSGTTMLFQKPAKELTRNQIDFDIVSIDMLSNAEVRENRIHLNQEVFENLIIPHAERLPEEFFKKAEELIAKGMNIIFIDGYPIGSSEDRSIQESVALFEQHDHVQVVSLSALAKYLRSVGSFEVSLQNESPSLRYYQYRHGNAEVYMFFNESPDVEIENTVLIKQKGYLHQYDALENKLYNCSDEQQNIIPLSLAPQESKVFIVSNQKIKAVNNLKQKKVGKMKIEGIWKISLATAKEYPVFSKNFTLEKLENISKPALYPDFSGTIQYELEFELEYETSHNYCLDLGDVYEVAEVFINEEKVGTKIAKPYQFNVTNYVKQGKNVLKVEVTNTLGTKQKDFLSQYRALQPSGLLGEVKLEKFKIM
ncbi:glycosylhydrolase-like jelly roll fold domain-containing protein [Niallia nealsonii]|uniref:Glycoside hydrolase n=1 Tax=Niallia nealsonii TaxID=115979 RepID=A0A2N0YWX6_9BACI|nr:glycosylhydrolase-like jelly roll fold domain-containing protein [Niallia nealsonii]PKG21758.1 glycoside hydrolase [Niallia nealsonii]